MNKDYISIAKTLEKSRFGCSPIKINEKVSVSYNGLHVLVQYFSGEPEVVREVEQKEYTPMPDNEFGHYGTATVKEIFINDRFKRIAFEFPVYYVDVPMQIVDKLRDNFPFGRPTEYVVIPAGKEMRYDYGECANKIEDAVNKFIEIHKTRKYITK